MTHITEERVALSAASQEATIAALCNRLNSDDPDFDDCSEAARWLRFLADREQRLLALIGNLSTDYGNLLKQSNAYEIERNAARAEVARLTKLVIELEDAALRTVGQMQEDLHRVVAMRSQVATLTAALEEANVDREAMRANDARYRWLRDAPKKIMQPWSIAKRIGFSGVDRHLEQWLQLHDVSLDAAIDAQLAITQEKRGGE